MHGRRSSARVLLAIGLTAAAAVVTSPAPAAALEPGVHVNPNSPAGIEYAFPLGSARAQLSGQSPNSAGAASSSAASFGVGVRAGAGRGAKRTVRGHRRTHPDRVLPADVAKARKLETMASEGSVGGLDLAFVGGVLVAGGLVGSLGSLLRRRAHAP